MSATGRGLSVRLEPRGGGAEISEKQARSIKYQITIAKLPLAKDIDEVAFAGTPINETLVCDLIGGNFLAHQRNVVLVGGTGTGKSHLAVAIARACIRDGARGRLFNVVDLVNKLEAESRSGQQGRLADYLYRRAPVRLPSGAVPVLRRALARSWPPVVARAFPTVGPSPALHDSGSSTYGLTCITVRSHGQCRRRQRRNLVRNRPKEGGNLTCDRHDNDRRAFAFGHEATIPCEQAFFE
jgi:hypothetical protein